MHWRLLFLSALPLPAMAISLSMPVECDYGKDCYIQHYVDVAPNEQIRDFRCNSQSYDGHKGTDFRINDYIAMKKGAAVKTAAAGTVKAIRNDQEDISAREKPFAAGKECGNGVLLVHENGWSTQYCHLKKGSIPVQEGDILEQGELLGQIGLSGKTEFPHLHFTVRQGTSVIDPFTGASNQDGCGKAPESLWDEDTYKTLKPISSAILNLHFADTVPTPKEARSDNSFRHQALPDNAPNIILWADSFGLLAGDVIHIRITDANGNIISKHSKRFSSRKAQYFQYIGKKRKKKDWKIGTYRGEAAIYRGNKKIDSKKTHVIIHNVR